jgi:hypothetical protein
MYLAIQQHCSISGPQTIVDVALISHTAPSFCFQSPTKFLQASSGDKNVKRPTGVLGGAAIAQQKMATRTSPQHTTTCKGLQPKCFSTSASMMVSEASAPVLQHVLTAQKRSVLQHVNPTNTTKCTHGAWSVRWSSVCCSTHSTAPMFQLLTKGRTDLNINAPTFHIVLWSAASPPQTKPATNHNAAQITARHHSQPKQLRASS